MSNTQVPANSGSARRPRMRRVVRVVRDIDAWSVFKVGLVFHLVLYVIALIAMTLLWSVASSDRKSTRLNSSHT